MIIIKTPCTLQMSGKISDIMIQLNELAKSELTLREYLETVN